jgi:3-hydroxyisobutyrate dehydrogenase-like beta-hydroxyacid dehydrogenase
MNILWIGYGKMGEPMAARVAAAGHAVQVSDTSRERCDAARANDLEAVAITPQSAGRADVIVTSLPNDAAALQLLASVNGALSNVRAGALLIETSTISASASASIAKAAQARGIGYVRGPVSGSVTAAANGALTTFLSGAHDAIEQARPIVGAYASNLVVVGDAEQARTMKLAINLMVTTLVASLCEAYTLCTKGGIEAGTALEAIAASAIGSPHLRYKADALQRRDFTPTFTVAQMRKDLQLISQGARELRVPMLLGAVVEQLMVATEASGFGDEDYLACVKVIAGLAGLAA